MAVQRAVYTCYYGRNSPGVFFSYHALTCLLSALLTAGDLGDIFTVLRVSLSHNITPAVEFLLELYNTVLEKGLTALALEIMRLTSQMPLSVLPPPSADRAQMSRSFQGNALSTMPGSHMSLPPTPGASIPNCFSESLNLTQAFQKMLLHTKHKNWVQLGTMLRAVCRAGLLPGNLEQVGTHVAVAFLTDVKYTLPHPFATFAKTFCQECDDDLVKTTLGRIGVSLMLRYHKTHQWFKGLQVVEVLSGTKVAFSTLKSFLGDEQAISRCSLVTMATELFLRSSRIKGALNTLRDNEWFLASRLWPCEPSDLEKRTHLLMWLAQNTSHRDKLEILKGTCESGPLSAESVDVSQYGTVFNAHLHAYMEQDMLLLASDLVELMMSKRLVAEASLLKTLLKKLYLSIPSTLGEVEMAFCLEMFITVNSTSVLDHMDTVLGLGPKLTARFVAMNTCPWGGQVFTFTLDMPSVHRWLEQNYTSSCDTVDWSLNML
ncbi:hypothetical protein CRUP_035168 [Coryphaenoides rupestris]|nr:hypothetical protein CRUP_035168 [Coryphaenoides rupestris]